MAQHRNHNSSILSTFKARAVCAHDVRVIAALLRNDTDYQDVQEDGNFLTWSSYSDSQDAFKDLALLVRDNHPDAHRMVGTFALEDAFTMEVFDINYFNYDVLCNR